MKPRLSTLILASVSLLSAGLATGCQSIPTLGNAKKPQFGTFESAPLPKGVSASPASQPSQPARQVDNSSTQAPLGEVPGTGPTVINGPASNLMPPDRDSMAARYETNIGDIIEVSVFPVDELKRRVEVDSAGRVSLPLIGEVSVVGKTALEIGRSIEARYRGRYVRNPNVSVFVAEKVGQRYTVAGLVRTPGTFPVEGMPTLLSALAKSGGLADTADFRSVLLRRTVGGVVLSAPFDVRAIEAGLTPDPRIYSGDMVIAASTGSRISVSGAVERPGLFPLTGPVSLTQSVALAGGIQRATNPSKVLLFRPIGTTVQTYTYGRFDLESGKVGDPQLLPGDRVVVEQLESKIVVSGAVVASGSFPWTPGMKLSTAVAAARGIDASADRSQVLVLREIQGETKIARFDIRDIGSGKAPDVDLLEGDRVFVGTDKTREWITAAVPLASFLNIFAILATR